MEEPRLCKCCLDRTRDGQDEPPLPKELIALPVHTEKKDLVVYACPTCDGINLGEKNVKE
jgi:hypothetical protein